MATQTHKITHINMVDMSSHCGVVNRGYNMFICNMGGMANSAGPYQVWVCTVCAYTSALICGAIVVL